MVSCLLQPPGRLRVANEVKKPAQEGEAVAPPETEAYRVGSQSVREGARVVVGATDCVGDDMSHRLGLLTILKEIGGDSGRPGDRKTTKPNPRGGIQLTVMETHVRPACLLSGGDSKLMTVGRQVA